MASFRVFHCTLCLEPVEGSAKEDGENLEVLVIELVELEELAKQRRSDATWPGCIWTASRNRGCSTLAAASASSRATTKTRFFEAAATTGHTRSRAVAMRTAQTRA